MKIISCKNINNALTIRKVTINSNSETFKQAVMVMNAKRSHYLQQAIIDC